MGLPGPGVIEVDLSCPEAVLPAFSMSSLSAAAVLLGCKWSAAKSRTAVSLLVNSASVSHIRLHRVRPRRIYSVQGAPSRPAAAQSALHVPRGVFIRLLGVQTMDRLTCFVSSVWGVVGRAPGPPFFGVLSMMSSTGWLLLGAIQQSPTTMRTRLCRCG